MQQVLGGQQSSQGDEETFGEGQSVIDSTFNRISTKEQRTFQVRHDDQMSFQNASSGFAPEIGCESQK